MHSVVVNPVAQENLSYLTPAMNPGYSGHKLLSRASYRNRHIGGIVMLTIGGGLMVGSGIIMSEAAKEDQWADAHNERSHTLFEWAWSLVMVIGGLVLAALGTVFTTKYSARNRPPDLY